MPIEADKSLEFELYLMVSYRHRHYACPLPLRLIQTFGRLSWIQNWLPNLNLASPGANLTFADPVSVTNNQSKPVTEQKFHADKLVEKLQNLI